jgi:hypothetical protein
MTGFGDGIPQFDGSSQARITIENPLPNDQRSFLDKIIEDYDGLSGHLTIEHSGTLWSVLKTRPTLSPKATFTYSRLPRGLAQRMRAAHSAFRGRTIENHLAEEFDRRGYHSATIELQRGSRFGTIATPLERPDILDSATEFFGSMHQVVRTHGMNPFSATLSYGPLNLKNLNYRENP